MVRSKSGFISHEIAEVTFYVIFAITMGIVLPIIAGFGLLAFEESFVSGRPLAFGDFLVTFWIYIALMIPALALIVFKIREIAITKKDEHPATQSNPKHLAVGILHDPEQDGLLYNLFDTMGFKDGKNPMRWSLSMFRTFIIAILIFGTLGLVTALLGFQFVAVPELGAQQITPTTSVLLSAEPAATSETFTILFVFCLFLGELAWLVSKFKLGKWTYFTIGALIISPMVGVLWAGFHNIVYGNNEAALFATFLFGTIGTLITLLSGTFIYFYVWHFMNNFFIELSKVTSSNEDVVFITIVILGSILFLWLGGEFLLSKYRKKKGYTPTTPD